MKKRKHLHTDFIKFLIEKYSQEPETGDDIDIPIDEEGEGDNFKPKKNKDMKPVEIPEDEEEETGEEDDEIIEELLSEYRKLKRQYENNRIRFRK